MGELEKLFYVPLTDLTASHAFGLEGCLGSCEAGDGDTEW